MECRREEKGTRLSGRRLQGERDGQWGRGINRREIQSENLLAESYSRGYRSSAVKRGKSESTREVQVLLNPWQRKIEKEEYELRNKFHSPRPSTGFYALNLTCCLSPLLPPFSYYFSPRLSLFFLSVWGLCQNWLLVEQQHGYTYRLKEETTNALLSYTSPCGLFPSSFLAVFPRKTRNEGRGKESVGNRKNSAQSESFREGETESYDDLYPSESRKRAGIERKGRSLTAWATYSLRYFVKRPRIVGSRPFCSLPLALSLSLFVNTSMYIYMEYT